MNRAELAEFNSHFPPTTATPTYIYALMDPETIEARYIGKTVRPVERLTNHMNERSACHRSHWLQSLRARGLKPIMVILERVEGVWPWQESERYWIARGRALGWPLTNNTSGGDGVCDLPLESRERMRRTWTGRKHRPESIEKMRRASAGKSPTAETRERMRSRMVGRTIAWVDKVAAALRKFDASEQAAIRARLNAGELVTAIANELGVHRTTISKIKKGTYEQRH